MHPTITLSVNFSSINYFTPVKSSTTCGTTVLRCMTSLKDISSQVVAILVPLYTSTATCEVSTTLPGICVMVCIV